MKSYIDTVDDIKVTAITGLRKSCSNSNNQWITTDIVIFVEYL